MQLARSRFRDAVLLSMATLAVPRAAPAQIAVVSATVQEQLARPGERYTATILVSNPSRTVRAARIYQSDYRFAADGTSSFDAAGSLPRSNAEWVRPSVTRLLVPPGQTLPISYSVEVPSDHDLRGSYWSMLMVEEELEPTATEAGAAARRPAVGLRPVVRYGVQVVSHLDPAGTPMVAFANAHATSLSGGRNELVFELHNTGERAFRPDIRIEVFDAAGTLRATARQQRGLLLPGSSLLQRFTLEGVAGEPHQALIIVDVGDDQVFGANYVIRPGRPDR